MGASGRRFKHTLKASGVMVAPTLPLRLGREWPAGRAMSKQCMNEAKNRKSSILARTSPRHIRRPTPNGMKYSGFRTLPSESMNREGRNSSGFSHRLGSMWTLLISGMTCEPAGMVYPLSSTSLQKTEGGRREKWVIRIVLQWIGLDGIGLIARTISGRGWARNWDTAS